VGLAGNVAEREPVIFRPRQSRPPTGSANGRGVGSPERTRFANSPEREEDAIEYARRMKRSGVPRLLGSAATAARTRGAR
jgi:hypothetical protein